MEPAHIANRFKIRCSAIMDIMGDIGLTDKQEEKYNDLILRKNSLTAKPLTLNMEKELTDLYNKKSNPELPDGAKTHCKEWLKWYKYRRCEEIKSKYITKGNESEEEGFTLMATELNLGMVYKNKERKSNEFMEGECDLSHMGKVYDNKSSWSLKTFPMFEAEIPDKKYWWQLQGYGDLWNVDDLVLSYTLNNSSPESVYKELKWEEDHNKRYKIAERMIFTLPEFEKVKAVAFPNSTKTSFIEIPDADRIKTFEFKRDLAVIARVKERVLLCRNYIKTLIK